MGYGKAKGNSDGQRSAPYSAKGKSKSSTPPWKSNDSDSKESSGKGYKGGKSSGKGYKGGKSDGKGKGKRKGPAPLNSDFWKDKVEEENREVLDGSFEGTIQRYNFSQGWGFILPDDPDALPDAAKSKLEEAQEEAKEAGKKISDELLLYFRKPDVAEGFKPQREAAVTFSVYIDDKGAGAMEVSG